MSVWSRSEAYICRFLSLAAVLTLTFPTNLQADRPEYNVNPMETSSKQPVDDSEVYYEPYCAFGDPEGTPLGTVLFDNIGRAIDGVGPYGADSAPTNDTTGFLSMAHSANQGIQKWEALSIFRPMQPTELTHVEFVMAQGGPNGAGEIDPFDPSNWPENSHGVPTPNWTVNIYSSWDSFMGNFYSPDVAKLCFNLDSLIASGYQADATAPINQRNYQAKNNYLIGFDVSTRVSESEIPHPATVLTPCTGDEHILLEAGKEYIIGMYSFLNFSEQGIIGVVSSTLAPDSYLDAHYDWDNSPVVTQLIQIDQDQNRKAAYMAAGEVTGCCNNAEECPCMFPPNPMTEEWQALCTVGNPYASMQGDGCAGMGHCTSFHDNQDDNSGFPSYLDY